MKKFIVTLLLISFISVIPSYGMKIITNKPLDRTVPSRCMRPGTDISAETGITNTYYTPGQTTKYGGYNGYQAAIYDKYYKPILGKNIRTELVGTKWYYPDYTETTPAKYTVQKTTNSYDANLLSRRYMREAADYFIVDTVTHPEKAVAAKYEEY